MLHGNEIGYRHGDWWYRTYVCLSVCLSVTLDLCIVGLHYILQKKFLSICIRIMKCPFLHDFTTVGYFQLVYRSCALTFPTCWTTGTRLLSCFLHKVYTRGDRHRNRSARRSLRVPTIAASIASCIHCIKSSSSSSFFGSQTNSATQTNFRKMTVWAGQLG